MREPDAGDDEQPVGAQRKAARRTALVLAVLAVLFYIGFFIAQSQR